MNEPYLKFTIITAVYNRVETIGQAIDSVSEQDYEIVEHIIVDGASTDGTLQEIQTRQHSSMRVISEQDNGIYDALNKGIASADGDVIGLMHSDDFFAHNDVLGNVVKKFSQTGADVVYGDLDYVSAKDPSKIIRHWKSGGYSRPKIKLGWMPPHPTVFVRREVFARHGSYDSSFQIAADYDAMLRWLWTGRISAAYIPEVLVKMRVGGESNRSIKRIIRKTTEDYRALKKNGAGGIGALACKNLRKLPQFIIK